ncbi:hypothetical protein A4H97_04205 [Niastella yeongjuensis]|uniref:DUF4292 domain-containing protein n=1 Tax=Niastella yeongjuensis TaxID=354355 RepID=A0A1V9EY96_9BACT|nr:DUF4292 domain-containing protein [Niastella yeongjuensis]OQP51026.1 hypothetical protein A4H97_04205 [Niastella yeongjuensis]SEN06122.1 protein of unknown function [Niastella yeongjuensis]
MKYISGLVIITLIMAAATSCRSTKTIQTAISKKDTAVTVPVVDHRADSMLYIRKIWDTIHQNNIKFNTFNAKIKVHFERSDGKNYDFTAYVKNIKDSVLWISVRAVLDFEVFRVKITPDSLIILDKTKKTAQLRSVQSLQEVIQIPLTFNDLQNLLVGNPIFLDSNINSYKKDDRYISLISMGTIFKHLLTVSKDDYTLQHSKLDDVDPIRARTADITYGDYQNKNGVQFSTYRKITVSEKQKLDVTMEYKQFDFNVDLNTSFSIPKNYKRN